MKVKRNEQEDINVTAINFHPEEKNKNKKKGKQIENSQSVFGEKFVHYLLNRNA